MPISQSNQFVVVMGSHLPSSPCGETSVCSSVGSTMSVDGIKKQQIQSRQDTPAPQTPHKKKSVSFNKRVKCRLTTHHSEYDQSERNSYWRTDQEIEQNLNEIFEIIDDLNISDEQRTKSKKVDETNISRRGLEFHTDHGKILRQEARAEVNKIVLEEQQRYFQNPQHHNLRARLQGIRIDEVIAKSYGKAAHPSKLAARILGKIDEQAVLSDGDHSSCDLLPAVAFQDLLQHARGGQSS